MDPADPTRAKSTGRAPALCALLVATVLAGTALRFCRLDLQSLWWDEIFSCAAATEPSLSDLYNKWTVIPSNKGLYDAILYFWFKYFGAGPLQARILSALCGSLAVALFARLAWRRLPPATALLATLLLAAGFGSFYYSQDARFYPLFLLASCAALFTWLDILDCLQGRLVPGWGVLFRLACLCAFMGYLHHYGHFLSFFMGLYLLVTGLLRSTAVWRVLATGALLALLVLPDLAKTAADYRLQLVEGAWAPIYPGHLDMLKSAYTMAFFQGWSGKAWLVFLALAGLAGSLRPAGKGWDQLWPCLYLALSSLLAGMIISIYTPMLNARYLMGTLPAVCLASAILVLRDGRLVAPKLVLAAILCLAGVVEYSAWHFRPRNTQWRESTQWCLDALPTGGIVLIRHHPDLHQVFLQRYQHWLGSDKLTFLYMDEAGDKDWIARVRQARHFATINTDEGELEKAGLADPVRLETERKFIGRTTRLYKILAP